MISEVEHVRQGALVRWFQPADPKRILVAVVLFLCAAPTLLRVLFGADFSCTVPAEAMAVPPESMPLDALHGLLRGSFSHTILEWTAFCAAILTWALTVAYFQVRRDMLTAVIGVSLFWAGCMDGFHTLAAAHLIDARGPDENLIPVTWAICRSFNALILLLGAAVVLYWHRGRSPRSNVGFVTVVCVIFGLAAFAIVDSCASRPLPVTMFPNALISRPWDVAPLLLYIVGGVVCFPALYRRQRDFFSFALWLSMAPQVATQLHMAFGSTQLCDHHFNVAHFLKVVAYLVPFAGLVINYVAIHRSDVRTRERLERVNSELEQRNRELDDFAHLVSHDLKLPLHGIETLSEWVLADSRDTLSDKSRQHFQQIMQRVVRMSALLNDLLQYARAASAPVRVVEVKTEDLVHSAIEMAAPRSTFQFTVAGNMPVLTTAKTPLSRVFHNLVGNAVRHHDRDDGHIAIDCRDLGTFLEFAVCDDGPGIAPQFHRRVFGMFQTLHPRDSVKSHGTGLAIVQKIVEYYGGRVWVESPNERGTVFRFTWPKVMAQTGDRGL